MTSLVKWGNRLNGVDGLLDFNLDSLFAPSGISSAVKFETDIYEKDGNWVIESAAPGVSREDISIDIDDGILSVAIERKKESKVEKANYVLREMSCGSQVREFRLPKGIDKTNPTAELKDGVLKIVFQKSNKKLIEIKTQ